MPILDDVKRYLADETGLATISTTQADGRVLSSIATAVLVSPERIIGNAPRV